MTALLNHISFADRIVGDGMPPLIIAEVAQAHDGSLGNAHAFIDAAAKAGADAIKFQTHIAAEESTYDEPFRVKFSRQDASRFDYWKRMEFTEEQWAGLSSHAAEQGLIFLSSAFSIKAVELLEKLNIPAWKVGSGEFRSWPLLQVMLDTKKPILLSTGMSRDSEIDDAVNILNEQNAPFGLFQCTSSYPTPLEKVGINLIHELKTRHGCPIGLSDHSGTPYPALAALARGVDMLELHVIQDKSMFGPDVRASVTFGMLEEIVAARDAFSIMDANPVDKNIAADEMTNMRDLFTKSWAPARPLKRNTVLSVDMLVLKKPGTGYAADTIHELVGRKLARDVSPEYLLKKEDLE